MFVYNCNVIDLSPAWINCCQPCDGTYEAEGSMLSAGDGSLAAILPPKNTSSVFVLLSLCPSCIPVLL